MKIKIPLWVDCEKKIQEGIATPLEKFVYDQEPMGKHSEKTFREGLAKVIEYFLSKDILGD